MGAAERRKGCRIEREIVHLHEAAGIPCERVPLSGAAGGSFGGDLVVANEYKAEVKARGTGAGFKTISKWLGAFDLLFLREDRAKPTVIMPWEMYLELMSLYRIEETMIPPEAAKGEG